MRRALLGFWVAIAVIAALGAGVLEMLGPLPAPARVAAVPATMGPATATPTSATPTSATPTTAAPTTATHAPSAALREAAHEAAPPRAVGPTAKNGDAGKPGEPTPAAAAALSGTPRIGLIIAGFGMTEAADEAAIRDTPAAVDLALSPYAPHAAAVMDLAHSAGHEVLLSIPMEPEGYPLNDEGPDELLTGNEAAINDERLARLLARFTGYAGATGALNGMRGERYAAAGEPMQRLETTLADKHLFYIDPRPGQPAPAYVAGRTADVVIDDPPTRGAIDAALARLVQIARDRGSALGLVGVPRTVTIEAIAAWAATLPTQGIALVPTGSLVRPAPNQPLPMPAGPAAGSSPGIDEHSGSEQSGSAGKP